MNALRNGRPAALAACLVFSLAAGALCQDTTPPTVTDIVAKDASGGSTPLPDAVLDFAPAEIVVTFSEAIDPATVSADTFWLVGSGGDGTFGDGNEVEIVPDSVALTAATEAVLGLDGTGLPADTWQVAVIAGPGQAVLMAHWKLDEGAAAGVAVDSSSGGYDGTNMGNLTTGVPGKIANAYSFDGVNDYVDCGAGIPDRPAVVTEAAWVKTAADGMILTKRHSGGFPWPTLWVGGGKAIISVDDSNYKTNIAGTTDVSDGAWHHIAGVKDGVTYSIYVDGVLENSATDTRPMSGSGNLHIGHHGKWASVTEPFAWFNGLIDDVRIYDRALSAAEIAALASRIVTDLAGNPLDGEYSGSLPSGDGTPGGDFVCTFEITAPTVLFTSPGDEAGNVPVTARVEVAFSRAMDETATQAAFYISGGVTGTPSWNGNALVFTPDAPLDCSTYYTVTITTDAVDASGIQLAGDYSFAFTTAAEPEGGDGNGCVPGPGGSPFALMILVISAVVWARTPSKPPNSPCQRPVGVVPS